ncbi:type II toxin-antitoxin system RelE/ParE family toxin [Jiella endophytica]|uniref:Type II toxin-antitoxin system RelE/ParE family toxin n=1 Tax=Jiella endophytica TaxID=2558362 RepID=A0A4Y8RQ61_9HYPH|nr:type II toxin-antitoxin system RelE/ParE family toxin [Jiella endophytica]TFF25451.1 type II toxin-antitoxin system RelE/ParE family toxin [Jiella endophytica]
MEAEDPRKIPLVFYRTRSGGEVVLEWLRGLNEVDRRAIGLDLMRVQYRWPIGMPLCRAMGNGLWEVRSSLPGGRIARVFFCAHDARIVVLSGFIKKTQKTPDSELTLARQRMKEFLP